MKIGGVGRLLRAILLGLVLFHSALYSKNTTNEPLCVISTSLWPPVNYKNDQGELDGLGIAFWKLIANKAGLSYRFIEAKSWSEVLEAIRTKRCDLTVATKPTQSRRSYALFSKPYATFPVVYVTRSVSPYIYNDLLLIDKTVALPKSYATTEEFLGISGEAKKIIVEDIDKALHAVEQGSAFATLGVLPVVNYLIGNKYTSLKISGELPFDFSFHIMARNDRKELIEKINRVIDEITTQEFNAIYFRYLKGLDTKHLMERKSFLEYFSLVTFTLAAALILLLFYLYRLFKKEHTHRIELKEIAYHDALTGAYSRAYAMKLFESIEPLPIEERKKYGFVLFDIDFFKEINDNYGHYIGDRVLKEFATSAMEVLKDRGKVIRWGGDEFLLIVYPTNFKQLNDIAQAIVRYAVSQSDISLQLSYALKMIEGKSITMLLRILDDEMYAMKRDHHTLLGREAP